MTLAPVSPALGVSRRRRTSIWFGAIITSACVAGGATVALSTLHPVQKPADVAKTYLEARYAGNWSEAWALECMMTRTFVGSYADFVEDGAYWDQSLSLPRHVEVAVGDIQDSTEESAGFTSVAVTVTSAEKRNWSISGQVPLVVEDGQFRVCDGGLALD
jgi:hypothetical protein